MPTDAERFGEALRHWRMIRRGECHVYNGHAWHFCDVHDVLQALERHL